MRADKLWLVRQCPNSVLDPLMPDIRVPLTERAVLKMPFATAGQYLARDTERKSFFVLVGRSTKTFMIQASLAGKSRRWNLGRHPDLSVREARDKATEWLARIPPGKDPPSGGPGAGGPPPPAS